MKTTLHNDSHADAQQTRHWSTAKQAKRVSEYCSRWKIWASSITLCACATATTAAPVTIPPHFPPSSGELYRANIYGQSTAPNPQSVGGIGMKGCHTGLISSGNVTGFLNGDLTTTSDGAYTGYNLGNDTVLAIVSGTMKGPYTTTAGSGTATLTWATNGTSTKNVDGENRPWCMSGPAGSNFNTIIAGTTTVNAYVVLYAGPSALPGVPLTIPALSVYRKNGNVVPLVNAGTTTVSLPSACTISLQNPTVNFGTVQQNALDSQILGYFQSALNINCTTINDGGSGAGTAAMTLSFSGTQGRYTDTVALQGTEGQGNLAEVRGVRATGTGSCDNNPDRIQFQGQQYSVGNVGVGQTSVPLTWSLCSNGSGLKGVGTAQATATLTWP